MEHSILDRTEDWARTVLESLGVDPNARGTGGEPLGIPIDETVRRKKATSFGPDHPANDVEGASPPRRPPSRRDSQRRREALLKGKEGSRQRRRWENDRLMHVPNAQPPLPCDWEVHPTHPVHHNLPYHVAQYWDRGLRQHVNEARAAAAVLRRKQIVAHQSGTSAVVAAAAASVSTTTTSAVPSTFGMVTRQLRVAAKKTSAVKSWVRVLEEPVRQFVLAAEAAREKEEAAREAQENKDAKDADDDHPTFFSDDEDEIVFVGRREMLPIRAKASWKPAHREVAHQQVDTGIVFDALGDDESGSFKRWLTHSISDYYGLASRSATVGSPPQRVVYVTLRDEATSGPILLPRPMWELF